MWSLLLVPFIPGFIVGLIISVNASEEEISETNWDGLPNWVFRLGFPFFMSVVPYIFIYELMRKE